MTKEIRRVRGLVSMVRLVLDPNRLDEVFTLIDTMESRAIVDSMLAAFALDAKGARALRERPRVGRIDLAELRRLPEGMLGRAYAEHMIANGLDPSAIPSLPSHDAPTFMRAHLYESHDVWHVVTGFGTDVAGELGLQAFGLAQFPSRLGAVLVAGGLLHAVLKRFDERDARMRAIVRGWLLGRRAKQLFGERWGEMWGRSLESIRHDLAIDLAALEAELPPIAHEVPAAA